MQTEKNRKIPFFERKKLGEIGDLREDLLPLELQGAHPERKKAFLAGRECAQKVCEKRGVFEPKIGRDEQGRPIWPPGIVGSITHSREWAFAVAGGTEAFYGMGIDAEKIDNEARGYEAIIKKILTPGEQHCFGEEKRDILACFCLKEAFYKCLDPVLGGLMTYQDMREMEITAIEWATGDVIIQMSTALTARVPASSRLWARCWVEADIQHLCAWVGLDREAMIQ